MSSLPAPRPSAAGSSTCWPEDPEVERVIELPTDQLSSDAAVDLKRGMEGATNLVHLHDDAPADRGPCWRRRPPSGSVTR